MKEKPMIDIAVCIDDTDNAESIGTGRLASRLGQLIFDRGCGQPSRVTRHQLYVHDDVPYTSHNSAMCFFVAIVPEVWDRIIEFAGEFLETHCAPGSDPGLCVARLDDRLDRHRVIEFGQSAKKSVLGKSGAYAEADLLGVHLSEHGGTGDGVVGALAGIGLRLTGNDGRFRGWLEYVPGTEVFCVDDLCAFPEIDCVQTIAGQKLSGHERVAPADRIKTVLRNWQSVVLVHPAENPADGPWQMVSRHYLKQQQI